MIDTREFGPKWQEEILEGELVAILAPKRVENAEWLLCRIRAIYECFTFDNRVDPLQFRRSGLLQEVLPGPS